MTAFTTVSSKYSQNPLQQQFGSAVTVWKWALLGLSYIFNGFGKSHDLTTGKINQKVDFKDKTMLYSSPTVSSSRTRVRILELGLGLGLEA